MRILYISHSFPLPGRPLSNVGGMQRVAVDLSRAFAAHSEVKHFPLVLETSWRWTGVRTPPFLLRLLREIPRRVREEKIDVVLFSSMVTAGVAPLVRSAVHAAGAQLAAIPVGRDVSLPNPIYQRYVPRVLGALDLLFPISRATAQLCLERGARPEQLHVVPCGIDLATFDEAPPRERARLDLLQALRRLGYRIEDDALLLLSVGRHQERKGFHWFVDEVMPGLPAEAVYLLAGSGPMTPQIAAAIARQGLEKRVVLLGQVAEQLLGQLYQGADLFLMPNIPVPGDIEGFGVVMLEAGAAGLPVLAADLEGIRDVIEEGVNGQLISSGDAAGFQQGIERFRDREVLAAASARAAAHVRSNFTWGSVVERQLEVLRAVGAGAGAAG